MESEKFLKSYELINKSLANQIMDRTFNSIGSNIFFEFGEKKEIINKEGRKHIRKEWSIWIGDVSWRITKNDEYITGSGDSREIMQPGIEDLLGLRFQSLLFLSRFLDAEFIFENGYRIETFFNWMEENQWTVFLADGSNIGVDCSSEKEILNVQNIARQFQIQEDYKELSTPVQGKVVQGISYDQCTMPILNFEDDFSIYLESCAWRLEKDDHYIIGCLDDNLEKTESALRQLIGNKLQRLDIANSMMDARLQFEGAFVLKTFSCCHIKDQWKINKGKDCIFTAMLPNLS